MHWLIDVIAMIMLLAIITKDGGNENGGKQRQ